MILRSASLLRWNKRVSGTTRQGSIAGTHDHATGAIAITLDGRRYPDFGRIFEERRYETLPYWATRSRFDHFYRLAVNTRLPAPVDGVIRVGDEVVVAE